MNRRSVFVSSGFAVAAVLAGCLDDRSASDDDRASGDDDDGDDDDEDEQAVVTEDPRISEPAHEIVRPDPPDERSDPEGTEWNADYLGEQLETEPSLEFEALTVPSRSILNPVSANSDWADGEVYHVRVVQDGAEYESTFDDGEIDDEIRERLHAVDFDESGLVVVESGYGSGSVAHRWARVEDEDGIAHCHGYHTDPYVQTDDLTTRASVLEVALPPDGLEFARASLTVGEDRRVHFNSTEGVVTLEE